MTIHRQCDPEPKEGRQWAALPAVNASSRSAEAEEASQQTYYIRRHYAPHLNRDSHTVEGMTGLSLEEAQAHCSSPASHRVGEWFDGYHKE